MKLFSIGEFSKITGLTVKTLRFYHEQGVLIPTRVDAGSGYRYYSEGRVETARAIARLRQLDVSLSEIATLVSDCDDDSDLLEFLEQHRQQMQQKMAAWQAIVGSIDQLIQAEREARRTMSSSRNAIETKTLEPMLIAGIRLQGRYSDCGPAFGRIGRAFGRWICGKAMLLHFCNEYREDDADFEACIPIKRGSDRKGITVRTLPGGQCVSLLHHGPWEELGRSYEKILAHIRQHQLGYELPTREIYVKGPGMIFKGNPAKYITEIQFMLKS
jgi:DNA-binding transcriptional MerR regulator/effector-binding domain-containing protein